MASTLESQGGYSEIESFSDLEMRIAVAIFAVKGMIGALPAGLVTDIIGHKNSLLLNNVLVGAVAVILQCFAVHPAMFIIGRFVVGINAGFNTVVVPLYISEILHGSVPPDGHRYHHLDLSGLWSQLYV